MDLLARRARRPKRPRATGHEVEYRALQSASAHGKSRSTSTPAAVRRPHQLERSRRGGGESGHRARGPAPRRSRPRGRRQSRRRLPVVPRTRVLLERIGRRRDVAGLGDVGLRRVLPTPGHRVRPPPRAAPIADTPTRRARGADPHSAATLAATVVPRRPQSGAVGGRPIRRARLPPTSGAGRLSLRRDRVGAR